MNLKSFFRKLIKRKPKPIKALSLSAFYKKEFEKLKKGAIILNYKNNNYIFQLSFDGTMFILKRVEKKQDTLEYKDFQTFDSLEDFNKQYLTNKSWYLTHKPFKPNNRIATNQLIKVFIIKYFNKLRASHDFSFEEYNQLDDWDQFFFQPNTILRSEYRQYCPNCKKGVPYFPRYPKYLCNDCSSKKITDEDGTELVFSNITIFGGFRISYKKNGEIIKEDENKIEKLCYIEGLPYIAGEAKFGGIVLQPKEFKSL